MAGNRTEVIPKHRILREVYRHYLEFKSYVSEHGESIIEHGYFVYEEDGKTIKSKEIVVVSFWDLHSALDKLSKRKREAVFYNVILDLKQRDVADIMGITTVSVGQYVEQAMRQLAERYFAEESQVCKLCGKNTHLEPDCPRAKIKKTVKQRQIQKKSEAAHAGSKNLRRSVGR